MKKEKEITPEVEETKPAEEPVVEELPEPVEEQAPKYSAPELQNIEDARLEFLRTYRSQNRFKSIFFFVALFVLVASFIVIPNIDAVKDISMGLMIGIAVVALAIVLIYSFLTKKNMSQKMRDYFGVFYGNTNEYVFAGKTYGKVIFENPGKIEPNLFLDSQLYANILEVRSRGATHFEYKGKQMLVCDCAGSVKGDRRVVPVFVGKYLVTGNSYKGEQPIYIYIKGDERALPPNNMDEQKIVLDEKTMTVYSNDKKWNKTLSESLMKKIQGFKPNKELVDISIAIQPGTTYIAMGYDDPLMVVPLEQPFDENPVKLYKKDLVKACEIAKELD